MSQRKGPKRGRWVKMPDYPVCPGHLWAKTVVGNNRKCYCCGRVEKWVPLRPRARKGKR